MSTTTHDSHSAQHVHVMPPAVLIAVFVALMALTLITVAVTYVNLGALNIWVALGIAVVKAGLVAMYFMHLRYDHPFHGVVLIIALGFVILFIGAAIGDTSAYQKDFEQPASMSQ